MQTYNGSCHCGDVTFSFNSATITEGARCNCSICRRKGAVMSTFTLPPEQINIEAEEDTLGLYQFDTKVAQHYFCKACGIYPFHQTMSKPGEYRINLGCLDGVDTEQLTIQLFDGKSI